MADLVLKNSSISSQFLIESHESVFLAYSAKSSIFAYFFTESNGSIVKVEYSFGYFLDSNGNLKINLHHSSLPFSI